MNLETIRAPQVSFQSELLILRDFNANVSKGPECGVKRKLMFYMNTFNMTQVNKDSTRVTDTTDSSIDLIMVSDVDKISQQGVLPSGLSDHFITYCTRKTVKSLLNKHLSTIIRSLKHNNKEMLTELLQAVDWSPVLNCPDVNEAWSHFTDLFKPIVDKLAPLKGVRLKHRSEPWFSSEILELIKERDEINSLCTKSSTPD